MNATTIDGFLDNTFAVLQPSEKAHRAGLDAMLLAACLDGLGTARVMDFGAGCGAAGFAVAQRNSQATVTLVERDGGMAELARGSLELEQTAHLADRVVVLEADLTARGAEGLPPDSCDHVLANPPYNDSAFQLSPNEQRAAAHAMGEEEASFETWLRTASRVICNGGSMTMIVRPQSLAAILAAMEGRFGGICVKPVHPKAGKVASRILVQGVRGRRAPLSLLPPLILHGDDGAYLPEADAILRGRNSIAMTPCNRTKG
jgi:tRNA1(Val) A37 N6-methylase TrmN6